MDSATVAVAAAVPVVTTKSKRAAEKAVRKAAAAVRKASEALVGKSVDSSVQHTNDDSVLSKRSAAKHGYLEDNYLRHFVRKPARRAPLINRGYYLRIVAMTELVEQCLQNFAKKAASNSVGEEAPARLQVLSLGAGFDTLAPRLYRDPRYQQVHFYEVDFPPVIANKTALVAAAPKGSFPFMSDEDTIAVGSTTMNFGRFHSLGLDLRETESQLSNLLSSQGFDHAAPTVVYAECVMQYMTPDCSDGVVRWAAANLPNAVFMAYDQINPYDSFGGVMQQSLRSKCSPLAGIHAFPNGAALSERAVRLGLEEVRFANFYDLSHYHLSGAEKGRVDALEMFDEYEEWCEMCEHYGILCALTRRGSAVASLPDHPALVDVLTQKEADDRHLATLAAGRALSPSSAEAPPTATNPSTCTSTKTTLAPWPNARLGMECYGNGSVHSELMPLSPSSLSSSAPQRLAASVADSCIVAFGGVSISKGTTRTDALFVHSLREGDLKVIDVSDAAMCPSARSHHTFTRIAPFTYVVFGGRTNPTTVYNDSYLCELKLQPAGASSSAPTAAVRWTRLAPLAESAAESLPPPRFRHADVALGDGRSFVVIGGRAADGSSRLADVWHATVDAAKGAISWREMVVNGDNDSALPPHCTAAACLVPTPYNNSKNTSSNDKYSVILSGGMSADDATVGAAYHLLLDPSTNTGTVKPLAWSARVGKNVMGRYAHTATILPPPPAAAVRDEQQQQKDGSTPHCRLLLFGGLGFVPKTRAQYWQPLIVDNPLEEDDGEAAVATIAPLPEAYAHTSFVRHSVVPLGHSISAAEEVNDSANNNNHNNKTASVALGVISGGFTCFSFGIYSPAPLVLSIGPCPAAALLAEEDNDNSDGGAARDGCGASCEDGVGAGLLASVTSSMPAVPAVPYSAESWEKHYSSPFPVVLTGAPIGTCVDGTNGWANPSHLKAIGGGSATKVAVHVGVSSRLDFVKKNFDFRHVSFSELVDHCWGGEGEGVSDEEKKETWYFRSVGANMKTESSNFYRDFAGLAAEFTLPEEVKAVVLSPATHHQSCFRINQKGMRLWPHYDVMDNILVNVVGRKKVVLFPPTQYANLYMSGSSSPVLDVCSPDVGRYPRALEALRSAQTVTLEAGDVLVIPALWIHAITAVDACVSVNLFYKRASLCAAEAKDEAMEAAAAACSECGKLTPHNAHHSHRHEKQQHTKPVARDPYDDKDLYGNKDLPCMVEAKAAVMAEVRRQLAAHAAIPSEFKALMLQQLIVDLQEESNAQFVQSQMRR